MQLRLIAAACLLSAVSTGQPPAGGPPARAQEPIRVGVDLVTSDVVVRDRRGQFVADLARRDFEVYEDGVRQEIVSFVLSHGGRILNVEAPAGVALHEGVILPPARPAAGQTGRMFVVFIDDFHLDPPNTPRIRALLKQIATELIHDGDLFAAVSTGPSSIEIQMTYDRRRLELAIDKVMGGGLQPNEIIEAPRGAQGNAEVRHRAHVAFRTAWDILQNLERVHDRRKAFIYISSGYDFAPFEKASARLEAERYGRGGTGGDYGVNPFLRTGTQFSEADLAAELAELTRAANRANATIYTIDPRGLVGGPGIDQRVDMVEWQTYVTGAQNSLRVLAESTGGFAVVNRNDLESALKRIDAATSDYYMIGYYSTNPDPTRRRRAIEVRVTRPGLDVTHRTEYVIRPRKP